MEIKMKFKSHASLILAGWLFSAYSAWAEQFVASGSGGHAGITDTEANRNIKVSISAKGDKVSVNGSKRTLEELDRTLAEFAKQKGEIWYHKSGPKVDSSYKEPLMTAILYYVDSKLDPASTIVFKAAADYHLPVRFSGHADFSGGNVREVQSLQDIILTSPAPDYPLSAKRHGIGGGGVFRQNIDPETGIVISVAIKQSTGHALLDRCAVNALRQWKYKALTKFKTIAIPLTFVPEGSTIRR
jgi:TonB family protein